MGPYLALGPLATPAAGGPLVVVIPVSTPHYCCETESIGVYAVAGCRGLEKEARNWTCADIDPLAPFCLSQAALAAGDSARVAKDVYCGTGGGMNEAVCECSSDVAPAPPTPAPRPGFWASPAHKVSLFYVPLHYILCESCSQFHSRDKSLFYFSKEEEKMTKKRCRLAHFEAKELVEVPKELVVVHALASTLEAALRVRVVVPVAQSAAEDRWRNIVHGPWRVVLRVDLRQHVGDEDVVRETAHGVLLAPTQRREMLLGRESREGGGSTRG